MEGTARPCLRLPSPPAGTGTKLRSVLAPAGRTPISMPGHAPGPFLRVQCNRPQSSRGRTGAARASAAGQVPAHAQPVSRLPRGLRRPAGKVTGLPAQLSPPPGAASLSIHHAGASSAQLRADFSSTGRRARGGPTTLSLTLGLPPHVAQGALETGLRRRMSPEIWVGPQWDPK